MHKRQTQLVEGLVYCLSSGHHLLIPWKFGFLDQEGGSIDQLGFVFLKKSDRLQKVVLNFEIVDEGIDFQLVVHTSQAEYSQFPSLPEIKETRVSHFKAFDVFQLIVQVFVVEVPAIVSRNYVLILLVCAWGILKQQKSLFVTFLHIQHQILKSVQVNVSKFQQLIQTKLFINNQTCHSSQNLFVFVLRLLLSKRQVRKIRGELFQAIGLSDFWVLQFVITHEEFQGVVFFVEKSNVNQIVWIQVHERPQRILLRNLSRLNIAKLPLKVVIELQITNLVFHSLNYQVGFAVFVYINKSGGVNLRNLSGTDFLKVFASLTIFSQNWGKRFLKEALCHVVPEKYSSLTRIHQQPVILKNIFLKNLHVHWILRKSLSILSLKLVGGDLSQLISTSCTCHWKFVSFHKGNVILRTFLVTDNYQIGPLISLQNLDLLDA